MGKKKKKKGWEEGAAGDFLGISTKSKLAKKYGVKKPTGGGRALEMQGLSGSDYRSDKDYKKDIAKAMSNDYDVRRSIEAAAMSGDKKAQKMASKGIEKYKDVEKTWDYLSKLKKEHVGGGGMFGAKNAASLTHAMVEHDRDTHNEDINKRIEDRFNQFKGEPKEEESKTDIPVELSERAQNAYDFQKFGFNPRPAEGEPTETELIFGAMTNEQSTDDLGYSAGGDTRKAYDPMKGESSPAAGAFLAGRKEDYKTGMKNAGMTGRGVGAFGF